MRALTPFAVGASSLLGLLVSASAPGPAEPPLDSAQFLRTYARFSNDDLARVSRGEPAARVLDGDAAEVAICAAIDMAVPPAYYLARFRDIEAFKTGETVLQARRFGSPPSRSDMAALKVADGDLDDLRECRAGACGVKLDVAGIDRMRLFQGSGGDGAVRLANAYREHLAAYAARYMGHGDAALLEYGDNGNTDRIGAELRLIVEHSPFLARELPTLASGITPFTGTLPAGLEGFLYWSSEQVGPRVVVTMTHAIVSAPPHGPIAIATKQIYASHYFTASLGLTVLADVSTPSGPRTRMIYVNRSRLDAFGGVLGGVKRAIARSRARKGADHTLRALKARLEQEYQHSPGHAISLPPRIPGIGPARAEASR
jgi:hypothetical protein